MGWIVFGGIAFWSVVNFIRNRDDPKASDGSLLFMIGAVGLFVYLLWYNLTHQGAGEPFIDLNPDGRPGPYEDGR